MQENLTITISIPLILFALIIITSTALVVYTTFYVEGANKKTNMLIAFYNLNIGLSLFTISILIKYVN